MPFTKSKYFIVLSTAILFQSCSSTQNPNNAEFVSIGRGAPVLDPLSLLETRPAEQVTPFGTLPDVNEILNGDIIVGPLLLEAGDMFGMAPERIEIYSAANGDSPEGIEPLETDLFNSTDFYKDMEHWTDPRYFRCNSSFGIEQQRVATPLSTATIGDNPPLTAAWGYCDRDLPKEAIVSPYEFESAEAHYNALLAETESRGGPDEYDYATVPGEWSGRYAGLQFSTLMTNWYGMMFSQASTIVSLLTDEYAKRFVQQNYHQVNTGAFQWPAMYCWPEGFIRRWHWAAATEHSIVVTPDLVQISTTQADNFVTNIYVGREFNMDGAVPRLGADVPRWYGETIGFWDGDALITWTSNIQGWMSHSGFEFSNKMQTIEIYQSRYDSDGNFIGINHEAIFYDPEALLQPVRIVRDMTKLSSFREGDPIVFTECIPTIFPINGRAEPISPGTVIEYKVPDVYGQPWRQIWEENFEQNMEIPTKEDIFSF